MAMSERTYGFGSSELTSCGCVAALRFNSFSYTGTFVMYFTEMQTRWQTSPCQKLSCSNQAHRRFQPEGGQGLSCEEPSWYGEK